MEEVAVPPALKSSSFLTARTAEVKSVVKLLEDCDHGRRAFQTLPRHMQRRQVSSNPKRLPRYLREQHMRENKNGNKIVRRPSRKYRRRPRNLLAEYNRRQRDHVWLETHIWHAKRFHMIRRWGYALPDMSTFKGYRSSVRAAKSSCLVQDISYMCCLELEGNASTLIAGLSQITQPDDFATLCQPKFQQGQQWQVVTFFKPNMQPYGALGDVDIMWLSSQSCSSETSSEIARVWIWVHPSAHCHVVETLVKVFELEKKEKTLELISVDSGNDGECDKKMPKGTSLNPTDSESTVIKNVISAENEKPGDLKKRKCEEDSVQVKKRTKNVNEMKLATRNVPFERTPKYYCSSSQVSLTLLKDTLNRFCLTGPEVVNVLKAAFIPAMVNAVDNKDECSASENNDAESRSWWKEYYNDKMKADCHKNQVDAWEKLSYAHLENRQVFPLTIRDPRVTLPKKKSPVKSSKDEPKTPSCSEWPLDSPIYESALRDRISLSKGPDAEINLLRSKLLVPGSNLPESPEESKLPVVMLSRPQTHAIGYGRGLDIIVCAGWGMSVWLPIILNGGVASGQQAIESLCLEFLAPQSPNTFPDTPSGGHHSTVIAQERRKEFFKRPPTCRRNLIKLGIQYPFGSPWLRLVQDWVFGTENVYALRSPSLLKYLASQLGDAHDIIRRGKGKQNDDDDMSVESLDLALSEGTDTLQDCNIKKTEQPNGIEILKENNAELLQRSKQGCLVKVKLIIEGKGSLEACAMICLPKDEDLETKESIVVVEPAHFDKQEEDRKKLKEEHEKIKRKIHTMKTNAKQAVGKKLGQFGLSQNGESYKKLTNKALDQLKENNKVLFTKHTSYNSYMENLWLMNQEEPLQCCSRKIMGYVTYGTFSMTIGRGAGIGWVALKPLLDCLQMFKKFQSNSATEPITCPVLVRNPSTLQYYWAKLYIIK